MLYNNLTSICITQVNKTEQIKALGQFIQSAVMFNLARTPEKPTRQKLEQQIFVSHSYLQVKILLGIVFPEAL